jgi:lipoyl(octanoyl) transferase
MGLPMARFVHLPGPVPYSEAHALQRDLVERRARDDIGDVVLLLEHPDVITVGRSRGAEAHVLDADGIPVVTVERGGDVTWHGPGQLVAYPIVKLDRPDLHAHLRALEQAVIDLLVDRGLAPTRDPRNTGVWLPSPAGDLPRKVCSVGIACRRWVTWHGLALNVDADLARFSRIRPCGFDAAIMTRMADHLAPCPTVPDLAGPLAERLAAALGLPWTGLEHDL